jgi:hypothetical protein
MAYHLAQHPITRRTALCLVVGLLLILCASFVPVGWPGDVDISQTGSASWDASLRPIAHLWSTDVVVPSLHRTTSYTVYSHTSLIQRTMLRRLASGNVSVRAQMLSAHGMARNAAQDVANTDLTNLPVRFPLLI